MRLNARYMTWDEHTRYEVRTYTGEVVKWCSIVDTDEGYAECAFSIPSGFKTEDDSLKEIPLTSYDVEAQEYTIHAYTLHTFELWDVLDNVLVAKV